MYIGKRKKRYLLNIRVGGWSMGTLIILFQRICFVEMAANQYKVTTGYKIIPQISNPRKIFLNIYG